MGIKAQVETAVLQRTESNKVRNKYGAMSSVSCIAEVATLSTGTSVLPRKCVDLIDVAGDIDLRQDLVPQESVQPLTSQHAIIAGQRGARVVGPNDEVSRQAANGRRRNDATEIKLSEVALEQSS